MLWQGTHRGCINWRGDLKYVCCFAGAAPADAIVNGSQAITGTGTYDSGDVCAPEANGFIYVKSACSNTTVVTLTVSRSFTVHSLLPLHVL